MTGDFVLQERLNRVKLTSILAEFCTIGNTPEPLCSDLEARMKPECFVLFCLALPCWKAGAQLGAMAECRLLRCRLGLRPDHFIRTNQSRVGDPTYIPAQFWRVGRKGPEGPRGRLAEQVGRWRWSPIRFESQLSSFKTAVPTGPIRPWLRRLHRLAPSRNHSHPIWRWLGRPGGRTGRSECGNRNAEIGMPEPQFE